MSSNWFGVKGKGVCWGIFLWPTPLHLTAYCWVVPFRCQSRAPAVSLNLEGTCFHRHALLSLSPPHSLSPSLSLSLSLPPSLYLSRRPPPPLPPSLSPSLSPSPVFSQP